MTVTSPAPGLIHTRAMASLRFPVARARPSPSRVCTRDELSISCFASSDARRSCRSSSRLSRSSITSSSGGSTPPRFMR